MRAARSWDLLGFDASVSRTNSFGSGDRRLIRADGIFTFEPTRKVVPFNFGLYLSISSAAFADPEYQRAIMERFSP